MFLFHLKFGKSQDDLEDKTVIKVPIKSRSRSFLWNQESIVQDKDYHLAPEIRNSEQCGFQLSGLKPGDKGVIETPNYPQNYPPNIQCIWWLKVFNRERQS